MPDINITIENKIAESDGAIYVCGNSDYVIHFDFDAEWNAYKPKTARFSYNGNYVDVVLSGNQCAVPVIADAYFFNIGVFAGDLHTTTPARVPCRKSILSDAGTPADPTPGVYNQIMERLNNLEGVNPATADKLGVVRIGENLKITKDGVLSVDTADVVEQDNTKPVTSAAVHTEIGNIEVLLAAL